MANAPGKAAYRIHLVDLFTVFPINAILKPEEKCVEAEASRLPPNPLQGKNYVVIGVGHAVPSRKLPVDVFKDVVSHCRGAGGEVVLLGAQRPNPVNPIHFDGYPKDECIDLIGKTSFSESVSIMSGARCVIGVDSGLIYLASLTSVPIICGYTYVDPYYRMPFRNGELGWNFYCVEPRGPCRYCSNGIAMFGVEFDTACPRNMNYSCTTSFDSADFIRYIKAFKLLPKPARPRKKMAGNKVKNR
jgi:hypothetical protein